ARRPASRRRRDPAAAAWVRAGVLDQREPRRSLPLSSSAMARAPISRRGIRMTTRKKTSAGKKATRGKMPGRREDFGAPIDGYFAKQSPHLREILETLRTLVEEAAPDASAALKWGMPVYTVGGRDDVRAGCVQVARQT